MQEYEPTPGEMTPVRRYYNDLHYKADSYIDLQIAAENLLEREGITVGPNGYDGLYGAVLPTGNDFTADGKASFNRFATLPLELIAPWVELTRPADTLADWYRDTAKHIRWLTNETHTVKCFELSDTIVSGCPGGDYCPRREVSAFLQSPTLAPDFDDPTYVIDAHKSRNIALSRLEVAKELNMVNYRHYLVTQANYTFAFERRFGISPPAA